MIPESVEPAEAAGLALRTQTRPPSRAGRNLPAAIGIGVGLGGAVIASLAFRKELFGLILTAAVIMGILELHRSFAARQVRIPLVPVLVGTGAMQLCAYLLGAEALLISFVLVGTAILAWELWGARRSSSGAAVVRDMAAGVFVLAYLPFLAGFAMLLLAEPDGAWRIVTMLLVPICSDIGGYVFGVLWGRHPMAPSVSPKKSWEGMAGSMLFGLVAAVLVVTLALDGSWWAGVLVGICAVITATVGDLSESLLKRDLGIKDMGSILPGHGGVLDRIDSLLPTAPVVYLLLTLLVPA